MSTSASYPFKVHRLTGPAVPPWLEDWLASEQCVVSSEDKGDVRLTTRASGSITLIEAELRNAASLEPPAFESQVAELYQLISRRLQANRASQPWRFWNYVPRIVEELPDGQNWYMAFNAGRYKAYRQWHGDTFEPRLTAASAVGHRGDHLHVHVVAGCDAGKAVENPRQQSAYRYSPRYGPLPPCFARATCVDHRDRSGVRVIVAGTASIVGEDTVHIGDTAKQMQETVRNLRAVVDAEAISDAIEPGQLALSSSIYSEIRAYIVNAEDEPMILEKIAAEFPSVQRVEVMHADLCRPDLLVEIDGVATVTMREHGQQSSRIREARA